MLDIIIWDVQHGSAAFINTPNQQHIVIDLGIGSYSKTSEIFSPLLHLKYNWGVEIIDEVIITHPHTDHIDDIFNFDFLTPRIIRRPKHLSEEDIINGNPSSDQNKIKKYLDINKGFNSAISNITNPELPANNGGVNFYTFTSTNCSRANLNNHSIVTIVEYLGVKVIIPGDNEIESWKELLSRPEFLFAIKDTAIFVASHHGRESGFYNELFKFFTPRLVIVSDGAETDTSAVGRYSSIATGWVVKKRSGGSENRFCLTTRNDGAIHIKIYTQSGTNYLLVSID